MHQRVLAGVAATITVTLVDQEGSPTAAGGAVTVEVVDAGGTTVLPAGTATGAGAGTGAHTAALTPVQLADLGQLTATWSVDGTARATTVVDVVGGYFFSVADVRGSDASLTDSAKYSDAQILAARRHVEEEAEEICEVAFVPRFRVARLDGTGSPRILLPDPLPRRIRSIALVSTSGVATAFSGAQLDQVHHSAEGLLERTSGAWWPAGRGNLLVTYEHGHDAPPADLRSAALIRLRHRLNAERSSIPDRATSFSVTEGGTYRLDTAGRRRTGIPEVDAAYARHSLAAHGIRA